MIKHNKKILIGFIVGFIIAINIYNIPLHEVTQKSAKKIKEITPVETTINSNIERLNKAINNATNKTYNFKNYDTVIIDFWATWCPSCKLQNQHFNNFLKTTSKTLIFGVCVDKNTNALSNFIKTNQFEFPVFNNNKEIAQLFDDITVVPTHFIINIKNQTIKKQLGMITFDELKRMQK